MALRQLSSSVACGLGLKRTVAASLSAPDLWSRAFSTVLDGFKYAKSHEWAHSDGSVATVGISDHAQMELGDVVYVELPEVGKMIKKGDAFGVVESVKAASDVYSPISGEVIEVNETLNTKPGSVNTSPFDAGWIIKVKLSDKAELDLLMDSEAYKKEIEH